MNGGSEGRPPPAYEARVLRLGFLAGLPGTALALALLWSGDHSSRAAWGLTVLVCGAWLAFVLALRVAVVRPLQILSNLLGALREGDFSLRARGADRTDALGLAFLEANALGETLREQRTGALEATALLRKVMEEIDVAVFAFDEAERLRLVNRAGERLLAQPSERVLGLAATEVGLAACLDGASPRTLEHAFPGATGRWEVRRDPFRQGGRPHELLVVADVSRALREEERQAWRRIIRVLGHEINNSLAPIHSIAYTLRDRAAMDPPPPDLREDLDDGLAVIANRSQALGRFLAAYARLARIPPPTLAPLDVGPWLSSIAALETRLDVELAPGPPVTIQADADQLEQALINLLRNAADAAAETGGGVRAGWRADAETVEIWVEDDGPGLAATGNLFVPFFTTKPGGTGIGLALSRQIAESHDGTLTLENRPDATGCVARLVLPRRGTSANP